MAMLQVPRRLLGDTGMVLSILGMGGSGYGSAYGTFDEKEAIRSLKYALDRGINFIDTAYWYGQGASEHFIGNALKGVPRERYFIATKVARYEKEATRMFDFSAEKVTKSAQESLERLQLDYVDLLQVHDVEFAPSIDVVIESTLPALQRLKERGLCRYIGITGYPLSTLKAIVDKSPLKIDSVLSYCRLTLQDPSLVNEFSYYKAKGIPLINASPVGMGLLTEGGKGIPQWHPASPEIKKAAIDASKYCSEHGVDITRLAINYSASFKEVTTTLVSMITKTMVDSNIEASCLPLTKKEAEVRDYIKRAFFDPLNFKHWEGIELERYRKTIKSL
ncbi:hypothetical protein EMCRGX_G034652 [Ephydatia muelleri]